MRKLILTTATLLALASCTLSPALAQDGCVTPDMISAKAVEQHLPVFYTLHGVDLGDEDKAEVIIFETEEGYLAIAFERGCYSAYATFDQEGVERFINENTRKANGEPT